MPIESAEECDGYLDRNHCGGGFRDNAGAGVDLSRDGTLLGRSGTVWGDAPRTGERRKGGDPGFVKSVTFSYIRYTRSVHGFGQPASRPVWQGVGRRA